MKTGLISKLIKMCIVVLIPLLASVGVGFYGYQYYQFRFFDHYMEKASDENTEDRLISYLSYINEKLDYSKEGENYDFYVKEKVSNEYGDLFTFSIIRGADIIFENYENKIGTVVGKRDNYYLTYYFAIYDVNYETLAKTLDPSGEHKLVYTELPKLYITLEDVNDEEKAFGFDTTTVAQVTGESNIVTIYDYGYGPEKDSNGKQLNAGNPTSMRYYVLDAKQLKDYSSEIKITVDVKSNYAGDDQAEDEQVYELTKADFYNNKTVQDSKELKDLVKKDFETVYNEDIFKAGYTKFVFAKYIWWEVLLAFVLVEVVCGSFVLVWNAEEEKEAKKASKKKR
jgi:hypothetical protein